MKKFEILPHTADLKIRAFGRTHEELFLNMLLGMTSSLSPEIKSQKTESRKIKIESVDLPALLVDFLSEVLYLTQVNKEAYQELKIVKFSDTKLEGIISGQKAERFGEDIKGVTYHDLEIKKTPEGRYEAIVVFDV